MPFAWLTRTPPRSGGVDRRAEVAIAELTQRAGLLYRLGFSQHAAAARLAAAVAWEYDSASTRPAFQRPAALSDAAIAQIVRDAYARRPGA